MDAWGKRASTITPIKKGPTSILASTLSSSAFLVVTTSGRFLKPGRLTVNWDSPIGRPVSRISPVWSARPTKTPDSKTSALESPRPPDRSLECARDQTAPSTVKSPLVTLPSTPHADCVVAAEIPPRYSRTGDPSILVGVPRSLHQNTVLPREYEFGTRNKISCDLLLLGLTNFSNRDLGWQTVNSRHLLYPGFAPLFLPGPNLVPT